MKKLGSIFVLAVALLCFASCGKSGGTEPTPAESGSPEASDPSTSSMVDLNNHTLSIYCGAGMTKPFEEISNAFKDQTGCDVQVTYANAGQIQTQINTAKEGDLFIAGSSDELTPVKDVVSASKDLVKHIPVLAVKSGNPLGIKTLEDLTNETVKIVLGDAEATPIGKIANKALTDAGILEKVNIVARTTTAPEIFNALKMEECDAIIVWKENVNDSAVEIVNESGMEPYTKTVPAASLSYCDDAEALSAFLAFLDTDTAKTIWTNYGYEVLN